MFNKALVVLAYLALVKSHDIAIGSNTTGRKVFDEIKQASPAIWRQVNNVTVAVNDIEVISRVIVTDLRPEKDGDVKIIDGGEGHKNVTLELKSPTALRGYDFRVEVYAVPDQKSEDDQETSTIHSSTNDGLSMDRTTSLPSEGNVPAIVSKDENIRAARTLMTKDKQSDADLNIPITISEYTTTELESINCTTEVPYNADETIKEDLKRSKEDAENHEVVDFVLEDMNDQSEKAALTSDSLKTEEENSPAESARSNSSRTYENDKIARDATSTYDEIVTTTQSDDTTTTMSVSTVIEDDYEKIDFELSKVPSIIFKMEPPKDKELPPTSDWSKQESRFDAPVMKHLGNQRN